MKEIGRGIRELFTISRQNKTQNRISFLYKMHKKNADTGPAARRGICDATEGGLRHEQASLQPEWRKSAAASEDLPSDRAGNPRSNSSGTMRLSATIVYQSAVRASSPKHKSGAHGEACELADSRSNGFRNCSGSRRSGHDPAAGRESGSNRRRPECCPEFSGDRPESTNATK